MQPPALRVQMQPDPATQQMMQHLYVMLSRATQLDDILIFRPPPRALFERGPPAFLRRGMNRFYDLHERTVLYTTELRRLADYERTLNVSHL